MDDFIDEQQNVEYVPALASTSATSMRETRQQAEDRRCTKPTDASKSKRDRSVGSASSRSSSSSSSSRSSSSTTSSDAKAKRSRRRKRKHGKKRKGGKNSYDKNRLDKLTQDIDELRRHLNFSAPSYEQSSYNDQEPIVDDNVSGILYNEFEQPAEQSQSPFQFNFDFETKLKESAIPKTPQHFLKILDGIQYFNKSEWSEVRYAEVQKLYNHTPGFVDLETNDEVKSYDQLRNLSYNDKAYAALSFCILKQREALQASLKDLISWASNETNFSVENMHDKINDLFSKGEYSKVSADLLQLVCGHRAEAIQMRRHGLINSVRDPLLKNTLRKIPPSNKHLFNEELFTTFLEKNGGVKKVFMPLNKTNTGPVSQTGTSRSIRHPSQGSAAFHGPSQGTTNQGCCSSRAHSQHFCNQQPSQGIFCNQPSQGYHYNRPSQGQPSLNATNRTAQATRGSFRSRGGNTSSRGQNKNERKRPGNSTDFNSNNKRRKY